MTYAVTGASSVQIDHGIGAVPASGSKIVAPNSNTTYTLTATGPGGTATAQATVTVITTGTLFVSMRFGAVTSTPYECKGGGTVTIKSVNPSLAPQTQSFAYSGFSSTTPPACQTTVTFQNLLPATWTATYGRAACSISVKAGQASTVRIWNETCQ